MSSFGHRVQSSERFQIPISYRKRPQYGWICTIGGIALGIVIGLLVG